MGWYRKLNANRLNVHNKLDAPNGAEFDMRGPYQSLTVGVGILGTGTFSSPRMKRWTNNGIICTEYELDITGLACKGDAANDVIGLAAGGAAYFDQIVTANHGIIFRAEMTCLEAPGQGTATITSDIDITYDTLATLVYDGAGDGAALASGGAWTAGRTVVTEDCGTGFAADNYLYLGEGSTAATTGVYNAGQFVIRLYGHAALAA